MSGWLWWLVGLGVVALGAALAYGVVQSRRKRHDPASVRHTERVTRRLYEEGGGGNERR